MRAIVIFSVAAIAVGCGGGDPLAVDASQVTDPCAPAWTRAPGLLLRTRTAAAAAARAWGGADLAGWRIRYSDQLAECDGKQTMGCTTEADEVIALHVMEFRCPEATYLAHEIGHVAIGDTGHQDGRWCDPAFWRGVGDALAAELPADDGDCRAALLSLFDLEEPRCEYPSLH